MRNEVQTHRISFAQKYFTKNSKYLQKLKITKFVKISNKNWQNFCRSIKISKHNCIKFYFKNKKNTFLLQDCFFSSRFFLFFHIAFKFYVFLCRNHGRGMAMWYLFLLD